MCSSLILNLGLVPSQQWTSNIAANESVSLANHTTNSIRNRPEGTQPYITNHAQPQQRGLQQFHNTIITHDATNISETNKLFFGKIIEPLILLSTPVYPNTLQLPDLDPHDSLNSSSIGNLITWVDQNQAKCAYTNAHHIEHEA